VADWLSRHGIEVTRLETKGYGKGKPKYPNTSDENRARNRRVEIVIVDK
jgi:chemotaxis protein MotB